MHIDYESVLKAPAEPVASSMIETFRAIGYSLETAVADIIDNSISANAKNIWVDRYWRGGDSVITVKDDGHGMSSDEIRLAMRPGSQNPLETRSPQDLGRFGLGLKTASFSQCRKVSVFSKKPGLEPDYWAWDLDYVATQNEWQLLHWIPDEFLKALDDVDSGTMVVWTDLDRVVSPQASSDNENIKIKFSQSLDRVKNHLAMTFHRFIEEKSIKIYWCGHEIEPWNPFCINENKIQTQPLEQIPGGVSVKGYVLPHQNNFSSPDAYKRAEGMNGWAGHQGFYVYRGKRLLLAGDWLGLFRKEEHYKLVRIQVDIPNTLDSEWQIDIKKSRAFPPASCREQLEAYAKVLRAMGAKVFRHRGKILRQRAGASFQPLWLEKKKDDKWSFVVNRDNAVIIAARDMARTNPDQAIETLLRYIEEAIPTPSIFIKEVEEKETPKLPFADVNISMIQNMMETIFRNKLQDGLTPDQARDFLKGTEPFNNYEELIDNLN